MRRIRIGNDFVYIWVIERMGEAEDLTVATSVKLTLSTPYDSKEIPFQIVDGNKIRVEFTPDILTLSTKKALLGKPTTYNLTLFYILPDAAVEDLDRVCTVDVDAFILVPKSAQADDVEEFTYTSDVGVGLKGDKGDKGDNAFVVWQSQAGNEGKTEQEYFDFLQEPANEAIQQVLETEGEIIAAEGLRVIAEQGRFNAEGLRYDAEILRIAQYGLSQQATQDANDAADLANEKAGLANQAAIDANNAVDNIASTLANKVDKVTGKSLILDTEIEKLSKVDLVTEKVTPIDADSVGLWDSVVNKYVRTKLSDFKTFLGLTFEKLSNKKSVMNPFSETDYLNSKGIADYVASVTKNENWVGVEIDPTLSCSEPAPKSTVEAYKATELKRTGNLYFHKAGNSRIFNAIRPAIVIRATKQIAWYLDKDDPLKKADGSISSPDWEIHNICIVIPDIYRRIRIVNNVSGRYEVALDIEPFAGASLDYPMSAHSIGFATVDRTAVPNQLVSVISQDARFRGGNNNAASDLLPSTQLGKPATVISRINFENYAANAGWETGNISDRTLWHELTALYFANTNIQLDFTAALTAEGYPQGGNGAGVTTWNSARWIAKNSQYPLHNIGEGFMTVGCKVGVKEMVDTKYYVGKVTSLVAGELKATDQFKTASGWSDTYIGYTVQNLQTLSEAIIVSKTDADTLVLDDDIFTDPSHWFWIKGVELSYQIPVFFGLEHLYGEIYDWVSGVNIEKSAEVANGGTGLSKAYICTDFSKRAATITPDYKLLGLVPRENGYIKELYRDFAVAKNLGAGSNTYMSDYGYYATLPATGTVVYGLLFGASAVNGVAAGVRFSYANGVPANTNAYFGARLRAKIG